MNDIGTSHYEVMRVNCKLYGIWGKLCHCFIAYSTRKQELIDKVKRWNEEDRKNNDYYTDEDAERHLRNN